MELILKTILLTGLLFLFSRSFNFWGSLPWYLQNVFSRIPGLAYLVGQSGFDVIFKLASLILSSLSVLLAIGVYRLIFGPFSHPLEIWIIFVICCLNVMKITHDIFYFRIGSLEEQLTTLKEMSSKPFVRSILGKDIMDDTDRVLDDNRAAKTLAFLRLTDTALPQLFRFLINMGCVYFCLAQLRIFPVNAIDSVSLSACLYSVFSSLSLTTSSMNAFVSQHWVILGMFMKFVLFFWAVVFISAAPGVFSAAGKRSEELSPETGDE